ncbi:41892_t:CDS:2 [Gigaspora margarita]|uniref:41892_t:CDS:1 n=1 Tax=Gigaspora margarita TaxID=4874 RepID=A0ABM8W372_GIGMA|nr:41892_t:CDS:2 [Gigaspora margarita]
MNTQHSTAQKSVPYQLVFRQLPHCDTSLVNLLENNNYSYLSAKGSDSSLDGQALISEMDFQPTILSEINNEIENIEETYDDSDTICDMDDLQEMNSDEDEWHEMNNSADEQEHNNAMKIEDRMVNSNEIILIEDSDDDFDKSHHYTAQEKEKWQAHFNIESNTIVHEIYYAAVGSTKDYTEAAPVKIPSKNQLNC